MNSKFNQGTQNNRIRVQLTRPVKTTMTGAILPAGTRGRVVGAFQNGQVYYQVDFGLLSVVNVLANSDLISFKGVTG